MRKGTKITIGVLGSVVALVLFLGFCIYLSWKNEKLSEFYMSRGEALLLQKDHQQEAINELEKALHLDPRNSHAEFKLLDAYKQLKQYRNIIDMQTSQMKSDPDKFMNFKRENRIAEAHIERGEIKEAKEIYESLITTYHKAPSLYLGLATCYEKENRLTEATKYQEQAVQIMKDNPKYIPKVFLKKEVEKLAQLYKQTGQEDMANKLS